ncbi:MAG: hypothetical protein FWG10_08160 [Eubacteriaceae bacterium]|nr:hypothetical protein [Eubacteriaceae bacterium]
MKTVVVPGPCKFRTTISVEKIDRKTATATVESECPFYNGISEELENLDVNIELFGKLSEGRVYAACKEHAKHTTCSVAIGILKAIEAEFKFALPTTATIEFIED